MDLGAALTFLLYSILFNLNRVFFFFPPSYGENVLSSYVYFKDNYLQLSFRTFFMGFQTPCYTWVREGK